MAEFDQIIHLTKWGVDDLIFQLDFIPEDKLTWKPTPEAKSAMEVVTEICAVMQMMQPAFEGKDCPNIQPTPPQDREDAKRMLRESVGPFLQGLENAGPELERTLNTPVGPLWAKRAVLFPAIEVIHHRAQVCYIQSLLGDAEVHFNPAGMSAFAPPEA